MRLAALLIAIATGFALVLRTWLTMRDGASLAGALWINARFFTILTNLLVALTMAWVAAGRLVPPVWTTGAMLWIGLVGLVYHALLAALWSPEGLVWVADQLLHTVTPLATFFFWIAFVPKADLRAPALLLWMAWPMIYCAYALARGAAEGIYPYPFLDLGALGPVETLLNVLDLSAAFGATGLIVLLVARRARS